MQDRPWIPLAFLLPFLALTAFVLEQHGFAGFYREAFRSSATLLMGVDLTLALGLVLLWMRADALRTGTPFAPYLLVTLAIGMAGPLAYLVHRALRRRDDAAALPGRSAPVP